MGSVFTLTQEAYREICQPHKYVKDISKQFRSTFTVWNYELCLLRFLSPQDRISYQQAERSTGTDRRGITGEWENYIMGEGVITSLGRTCSTCGEIRT